MRIGTIATGDGHAPAFVSDDRALLVRDVAAFAGSDVDLSGGVIGLLAHWDEVRDTLARLADGVAGALSAGTSVHPLDALVAPIPRPGKVIAVGRNYAEHAAELGNDLPAEPMIFTKHASSVNGPFAPIPRPPFVDDLDYEAELAVVVGRRARDIPEGVALDHVAGYCCANDVSARTAQRATGQFVRGKSFDGFCPLGPALVTRDEVPDPQRLRVRCTVDGEVRQDSTTALMLFTVAQLVAHCSIATTLEPGDVILTGTPAGVAMGRTPPPWLQPGQLCEVEIAGVGRIANRVVAG